MLPTGTTGLESDWNAHRNPSESKLSTTEIEFVIGGIIDVEYSFLALIREAQSEKIHGIPSNQGHVENAPMRDSVGVLHR